MIIGETSLSFLGVGLRPPAISWGVLLKDARAARSHNVPRGSVVGTHEFLDLLRPDQGAGLAREQVRPKLWEAVAVGRREADPGDYDS